MLCEALGRKPTAEERFAVMALTAEPSLLAPDPKEHSPTCKCHLCVCKSLYVVHLLMFVSICLKHVILSITALTQFLAVAQ